MSYPISLLAVLLAYFVSAHDHPCGQAGQAACSSPFPPGHRNMGPSWWAIGDESFDAVITKFTAKLYVPEAPQNLGGVVAINPAIENTRIEDLTDSRPVSESYQPVVVAYPSSSNASCGQAPGQWCTASSVYDRRDNPNQTTAPGLPVSSAEKGDFVELEYTFKANDPNQSGEPTLGVVATPHINGTTLGVGGNQRGRELAWQVWLKTECHCQANGTIPGHSYRDVTIVLDRKVPHFGGSVRSFDADRGAPSSPDGGVTWKMSNITINAGVCANWNSCS